ncbi:MAG: FG-GAP-like repeat-containing protein [Chloroflexota bacterium]
MVGCGGLTTLTTANAIATFTTSDNLPTIVSAGDVNGDQIADFAFSSGSSPVVVFGDASQNFTTQTLGGFSSPLSGFLAAVGDVDKDGRGDLLIGNAAGDAYLLAGRNLSSVAATIAGVATAASAPYIAAADLAGDGSSDLAVVPTTDMVFSPGFNNFGQPVGQAPLIARTALPEVTAVTSNQPIANHPLSTAPLLPGDVTVGAVGADFSSIQAAIDSGASRVLVQPGIYAETITLANNVQVIGSGADRTVLTFPGGAAATTLVAADGISNAAVLNLTLLGNGSETGLQATNGAASVRLERAIVQGMSTAVAVDNAATTLSLKNNTIVGNGAGFIATGNAGVNIRNTIFAYNTGTAVQYDPTAVLQLHQYNLYYANGTDFSPNNPGGGELFSDPLFLDFANGDFRTESYSPVVDAGTPNDLVPPGAGTAVDIGHIEQTSSSFFADDDYCGACINDGLFGAWMRLQPSRRR